MRRAHHVRALGLALVLAAFPASPARAAEATDVLDAFDGDDPFDVSVELNYLGHGKEAKITREDVRNGKKVDVNEFQYLEHSQVVMPRLRVGIFQDVELFAQIPYTVLEQRAGWYEYRGGWGRKGPAQQGYSTFERDQCLYGGTEGQSPERPKTCEKDWGDTRRSTLSGNSTSWPVNHDYQVDGEGRPQAGDWNGEDTDWDIKTDGGDGYSPAFHSMRGAIAYSIKDGYYLFPKGLGDAQLGFAFSPFSFARFNDARDQAMPAMRIEFSYQIPNPFTLETPSPTRNAADCSRTGYGASAKSCREKLGGDLNTFEPGGTSEGLHKLNAGFAMSKQVLMFDPYFGGHYTLGIPQYYPREAPERDWKDFAFWKHEVVGYAGVEIIPLAAPVLQAQEVAEIVNLRLLLGVTGKYTSKHRGSSEMSDALHKWTYVDNYVALAGQVGVILAVPFVSLKVRLEAGHESPHLITGESPGTGSGSNNSIKPADRNPYYNPVLDTPGRRIKVTESNYLDGMMQLAVNL